MKDLKEKIPSMDLSNYDKEQQREKSQLKPISMSLSEHLLLLAKKVTEFEVTPSTVRAACECASEIHKLLDLQWKIKGRGNNG